MRRREFIAGLGSAAAWPFGGLAQRAIPVVAILIPTSPGVSKLEIAAFHRGLAETGYVDGRNVAITIRYAGGNFDLFPALAAQLVGRSVDVIFAVSPPAVMAAKVLRIPVVFSMGEDPVQEGLVASLNRPGGNVTGYSNFHNLLGAKKLGLLHDTVAKATTFGFLVNPANPNAEPDARDTRAAAAALGLQLRVFNASTEPELDTVFAAMADVPVGALLVNVDPLFVGRSAKVAALAARYAIPAMYERTKFTTDGGLMSYEASEAEGFRQGGIYVGRILKGEKPADLPVLQATKFTLTINLKTAKVLGLDIPPGVLAIADEVIE